MQKQPQADTVSVTEQVEGALDKLQRTMPDGVTANRVQFRQATFIETSIENVKTVLVEAAIVVAFILILFLLDWRATLISLTAIPMSIIITVVVFHAFGLSINTMTLGGIAIAIGELVDDAVVGVENVLRRLKLDAASPHPQPRLTVVLNASHEVRSSIVYASAIVVLVFVPLFAMQGLEGQLFRPLGIAYIVAILASLVTSVTLTPVMCHYLLRTPKSDAHDTVLVRILKRGNRALLAGTLAHPRIVVGAILSSVVAAGLLATQLPRSFLPPFNEGTVLVSVVYNPGISLAEADRLGTLAEQLVMKVPEIKSVGRRTGRAELDEHVEGVHVSEPTSTSTVPSGAARKSTPTSAQRSPSCRPPSASVSRSLTGSITCCRACAPRSRSRSSVRISIGCGRWRQPCNRAYLQLPASSICRPRSRS